MRIIPAIDLKDGSCVRLFKGDFEKMTEYSSNPTEIGRRFSKLAVDELHIVDLDGARTGTQSNRNIVSRIAEESGLVIQLGGGIRTRATVEGWLAAGVSRCVVGSVAIMEPDRVRRWIGEFGTEAIVLALDVKLDNDSQPLLTTNGWTTTSDIRLWDCLDQYLDVGVKHILCTDVARDGAMGGPNLALYSEILGRYPALGLQASGGVRDIGDLMALRALNVPASISGRALLDGAITDAEIATFRQNA